MSSVETQQTHREFLNRWLAAWTGNSPAKLLSFYTEDCFYCDPAHPEGLRGASSLERYFRPLLAANPAWEWKLLDFIGVPPDPNGIHVIALAWSARIPTPSGDVSENGLDWMHLVHSEGGIRISRNEVYFDRTRLLAALAPKAK